MLDSASMLSILSLVATANAESLPLPESNPEKYEEVTRFLQETAVRAKELVGEGMPLIDKMVWSYFSLEEFNAAHVISGSEFPSHLWQGHSGYYPIPLALKMNAVEYNSPDMGPYRNPLHHDSLLSSQQSGYDYSYCYGGIRRYTNEGKTYDVETIEVEDIRARMSRDNRNQFTEHLHPVESNCITVKVTKGSTKPIRPLGKRGDRIRAQYGEFADLKYDDREKFYAFELMDETVFTSRDECQNLGAYEGFTYEGNWLKPELDQKEGWDDQVEDLCDFMAGYQTPPEK